LKNIKEIVFLLFVILIFAFGARIFDIGGGGKSNLVAFSEVYNDPDRDHEKYCIEYDQFINSVKRFKVDDVIIVPHFYNKDNGITISEKDELCKDLEGYSVIVEPANLVSMTIINSNEDYLSLVGSDVQDWSKYSASMALEIKFDIDSFSKFYELAREPKIFVKNALDGSESNSIKTNNPTTTFTNSDIRKLWAISQKRTSANNSEESQGGD